MTRKVTEEYWCDRCGKQIEPDQIFIHNFRFPNFTEKHLCKYCDELFQFWLRRRTGPKPNTKKKKEVKIK